MVCGSIPSLLRENRKIYTGFSVFLTFLKWKAVTKSHVSGLQPAGLGKDLLFASEAPDFFPAGDVTLEVGQCLDVVHKIVFFADDWLVKLICLPDLGRNCLLHRLVRPRSITRRFG